MPSNIPSLTTAQRKELECFLQEEVGFSPHQLLERNGSALALLAGQLLDDDLEDRPIVVLAGRGNNGGAGLAAARFLIEQQAWVQIVTSWPLDAYEGAPAGQLAELQGLDASLSWAEEGWELPPADLVIDAIIGIGLRGDPRGPARDLIQLANSSLAPILSLDAPSGLDTEKGSIFEPHIRASATLATALPQAGLLTESGRSISGDLYLADIGVPNSLYQKLELSVVDPFGGVPLIRLPFSQVTHPKP